MKKSLSFLFAVSALFIISVFSMSAGAQEVIDMNNDSFSVSLGCTSYNYNGNERKPSVQVSYKDDSGKIVKLLKNRDYTVSYFDNVNAGNAKVVIKGKGSYKGSLEKSFKINPIYINNSKKYTLELGYYTTTYSGKKKTPTPYLYWHNGSEKILLERGRDYTISFKNNINMGNATIYIYGCNNFKGSISKNFKIIPKKVSGLTSKVTGTAYKNSITLNWNKISGVSGYQIYQYNASTKKYEYLIRVSPSKTTYTVKNLDPATRYYYKVRAYKTIVKGKTYYYGAFSDFTTNVTIPNRPDLTSVGKTNPNTIKLEWEPIRCTGYEIYYSSDPTFKTDNHKIRIIGSKRNTYTIKHVSRYRTYYVRIRAICISRDVQYSGYMSYYLSTNYSNIYATYTTKYVDNANRTNNLAIASKAISGTIIEPGETFSFNSVVGARTASKGYKSAAIFSGGGVEDGIGGGICQVASTMFNTALYANVGIIERHQHSQRVTYVPLGRDAAIYGTAENFRWKNTTKYPIKIYMSVKNGEITCTFKTSTYAKPDDVSLKVSRSSNKFTLRRYVNGRVNYTCSSRY